ncbi:MAG: hypothetical protein RL528_1617 [Bacteroidota bacterium]
MKKIIYAVAIAAIFVTSSCTDYLDTTNLFEKDLENYYKTPKDINESISGIYNALYSVKPLGEEILVANILDETMLGGGGAEDLAGRRIDSFEDPLDDTYRGSWTFSYKGIARANALIEKASQGDYSKYFKTKIEADNFKNQAVGEALFMRAFFYFRLAKMFGGVPLITTISGIKDGPRATITETFAQIASDLKQAIEILPSTAAPSIPAANYGHANKWVAQAYMARVYLFYTGYMTNIEQTPTTTLPLVGGNTLTAANVTGYLNDCMANSGYGLVADFRNLWPYSYVNTSAGRVVLPWAAANNLAWAGQDGFTTRFGSGNREVMFAQRYSFSNFQFADWEGQTNSICQFSGMRENNLVPFAGGWGYCTVNPSLWNEWPANDPRKEGSIIQVGQASQGTAAYVGDKGYQETGFWNKKYTPLQHGSTTGNRPMFVQMYGRTDNTDMLSHAQDFIFLRYADVLLMHSEITQTATGMNAVRDRAGRLAAIPYSLDAIKKERLYEFAFEGLHWFDIVRWGDVKTAFNGTANVRNSGSDAVYRVTYRPETKGLLALPETEIRLSKGKYTQNPGW